MKKRVVYSYIYNDERRHVVDYLCTQHGWDPVVFDGVESMRNWVEGSYPDAVLHDLFSLRQGQFDYSRVGRPVPLDEKTLETLSKYESNCLSWLEDTTGWNFSFHERRRYYYDILKYWNTVIHNLKPDLFVAYTFPHLPSDYPFYLLCKHQYNIPVLFFNPIPYLNDEYYHIGDSLEDMSSPFNLLYSSDDGLEASDVVKEYLENLRSSSARNPKYVTDYWEKLEGIQRRGYLDYLKIFKMALSGTAFKKSVLSFKKNREPWVSDKSKLTNSEYILFRKKLVRDNRKLKKFYGRKMVSPDFNEKYIYFAGPYQPEVMSNLYAGVYEDIFLILDMVSQIIPDNWLIYA